MSTALVIGAGPGLSASLARALKQRGHSIVLASRDTSSLSDLAQEIGATLIDCNARNPGDMERLFTMLDEQQDDLDVAIYNPSARNQGPIATLDPVDVENTLMISAYGAFLMAHHAAKRMLPRNQGAMFFTGATAGVKGFANSAPFAMGKFALRGLCQSLARELHPKGIHIGHVVIDGIIGSPANPESASGDEDFDNMLNPDAIARTYMHLLDQHRSAWSWEIEIRPWVESF
ncbi:SDR family oxidoreductase [Pistricoccus aurantiacus]|uniref:SDR family oxidoreductase n=1 Tax=Pistricoccus aurantiacus TaxID=1883414 RepID=A0A5B8T0C7_9GAMM|nr:SDR family oxidoreductase [Pistricoccus aurantiacus]QEA40508.1 SDR family oxidoreductase [Pistricoccus aurantiacus]